MREFIFGLGFLTAFILILCLAGPDYGRVDLSQYWSAAKLFKSGGNPYDPAQMQAVQSSIPGQLKLIRMWNPPFVFPFISSFAFFNFDSLAFYWQFVSIVLVAISFIWGIKVARSISVFQGRLSCLYAFVVALSFYPIYLTLFFGQITSFLALSISGFLFFLAFGFEFAAGLLLAISLLKPHLFIPIYLWVLVSRLYGNNKAVFNGFVVGTLVFGIYPVVINPEIYKHYFLAMQHPPIYFKTATIGSWLQGLTGIHTVFVRFLPSLIFWPLFVLWLFRTNRKVLHIKELLLLLPLSVVFSPYGWGFDWLVLISVIAYFGAVPNLVQILLFILVNTLFVLQVFGPGLEAYFWYPFVIWCLAYKALCFREDSKREPLNCRFD